MSAEADGTRAAKRALTAETEPVVLAIDVGGSHVKILTSAGGEERARRFRTGHDGAADDRRRSRRWPRACTIDVVSMGYPGPVTHNRPLIEPANLGKGWVGYDFAAALRQAGRRSSTTR